MTRSSHSRIDSTMKIAVVLSVVAVAVATQDKIWPSVFRSLERTSTASVAVTVDDLNVQKDPTVFDWAKCNGLENELVLLCNDLIKEEIKSLAALPGVQKITTIADSATPRPPHITLKPTTTTHCPPNITPKPTTTTPTTTKLSVCDKPVDGVDYYGNDIACISADKDDCCVLCLTADN
ncbi:hypothetical protein DYB37_013510, partial [Aphanomyces astaci]